MPSVLNMIPTAPISSLYHRDNIKSPRLTSRVIGPPGPAVIDSVRDSRGRPLLPVMVWGLVGVRGTGAGGGGVLD